MRKLLVGTAAAAVLAVGLTGAASTLCRIREGLTSASPARPAPFPSRAAAGQVSSGSRVLSGCAFTPLSTPAKGPGCYSRCAKWRPKGPAEGPGRRIAGPAAFLSL